ncbi:eukaryotic translation initiation factor 3 subunit 8 [Phellopilus nigrolimitatus]|nr:eukaryotic translation initiation factor 3 subunit 8 [Phellopilus nigrolimitatus]
MSSDDEAPPKPAASASKPTGMSRFLKGAVSGSSSSESESEEDSDEDESDEEKVKKKSRFLVGGDADNESDEDVKRVVKSASEKRLDEMEAVGKTIENALKINDWVAISNEFDKLTRMVERQTNVAERVPGFYVRSLLSLDQALNTALSKEKEAKKKMNASNARALNTMKQKVRKTSKEYEKEIKLLQEDPEAFEREYAVVATSIAAVPVPKPKKAKAGAEVDEVAEDDFTTVGKGGKAMQYTSESIFQNLHLIQEARGKKNTNRAEQIKILEKLLEVSVTVYQRIRVLLGLVSSRFDYNSSITTHMPTDLWLSAQREVDALINVLASNPQYSVEEVAADYDELAERTPEQEKDNVVRIRGSIISFIDRLDDEFTKSLQNIDPHGTEYVERLSDEKGLYQTICLSQGFYEKTKQDDPLSRVILRRLEHIYSKPDAVVQALESALPSSTSPPSVTLASSGSSKALIQFLCVHLYKSGNPILKTRAMLSHVYHYALHNDFHRARDMLLMSHLQESVHVADVATQILYNRTVVQIGLCAFRVGLIRESQATLQDIFNTQRVKELLAQGVHQQRYQTLSPEQEKAERQRQLPFHMHINTELLEAAFLVSSMLVEIPMLASIDSEEQKRKAVSKPFRRLLDFADRQVFTGPPESTRDHIMQASKALQEGDWEKCRDLIQSIKIWSLMPESTSLKDMLSKRIQEEALRTYLFAYAPHYSTLSLTLLARTFSLPLKQVTSIVSKMIWSEELAASLDQAAGVVVLHHVDMSRVQHLALTLAERLGTLIEQNEKTLDTKQGNTPAWGDRAEGTKGEKRGEQTQERKGRSERSRGTPRGGSRGGRGARFAQGLGNRMPGSGSTTTRVR